MPRTPDITEFDRKLVGFVNDMLEGLRVSAETVEEVGGPEGVIVLLTRSLSGRGLVICELEVTHEG